MIQLLRYTQILFMSLICSAVIHAEENSSEKPVAAEQPHVVIVSGPPHYSPELTMPLVADEFRKHGFKVTIVQGDSNSEKKTENVLPNIEVLAEADLAIFFMRFLKLGDKEWTPIENYLKSGKPVMGFRTAGHAFNYPKSHPRHQWNNDFGDKVFGTLYLTHFSPETKSKLKPLLSGFGKINKPRTVNRGFGDIQVKTEETAAVAWTWENEWAGKVFFTSLGHPGDFGVESFNRVWLNAAHWAVGKPMPSAETKIPVWDIKRADKK